MSKRDVPIRPIDQVIREAMNKRGLRQIDLVKVCGSRGRTSEIVNGRRRVPKSMLVPLAKLLRLRVDQLL